jgi:Formyl transferase
MRIALLTTDTVHHAYFVREIAGQYPETKVFCETEPLSTPFETAHPFERDRDRYEREAWFAGALPVLDDFASCVRAPVIGGSALEIELERNAPDVTMVFGTRKLPRSLIERCRGPLLNFHGGDPEAYRGLDSHLWAIYHRDFGALSTCLHVVSERLDDGPIVAIAPVPLKKGMKLCQLRQSNTELCVRLALGVLEALKREGRIVSRPQRCRGRYYSFMPAVLKCSCVARFAAYTEELI